MENLVYAQASIVLKNGQQIAGKVEKVTTSPMGDGEFWMVYPFQFDPESPDVPHWIKCDEVVMFADCRNQNWEEMGQATGQEQAITPQIVS